MALPRIGAALVLLLSASPSWAGKEFTAGATDQVVANQIIVKLRAGTASTGVISSIAPAAQVGSLALRDHYVVRLPAAVAAVLVKQLAAKSEVEFVEPDRLRKLSVLSPNDPAYTNALSGQWALFTVQALQAWNLLPSPGYLTAGTAGTNRIKVAILDTGADCLHPDFMNAGGSSTDSAAGGQILWSGSMALTATTVPSPACSWQDDHGHGTHVSGIVAAATSNGAGIASLGYPVQLMEYKVLDSTGSASDSTIASAIAAAVNAGAKVISMSIGGAGYSQTLQSAINYAWQKNVVVVAAAGNSSTNALTFPGGANYAVGVSATDIDNNRATFSNFGSQVSLGAPGVNIVSTIPRYSVTLGCCNYGSLSGTSMATPLVSALAGLVSMTTPNATAASIVQRLEQSAVNPSGSVWNQDVGFGIINAYSALAGANRTTGTGGVRGQIVDTSGLPVSGAQVTVAGQTVVTDSTGLFWIRPVAAGTYSVAVSASGFPTQNLSATVAAGADTSFSVVMGLSYGRFTGTVTDQGVGVSGAIVQAISGGSVIGTAITDGAGQYTLWVAPGSGYTLQASLIGANTASSTSNATSAGGNATVNLSMTSLVGAIAGTILNSAGGPAGGAQVSVSSAVYSASAVTDASGRYILPRIPPGTYSVTASATGEGPVSQGGITVGADSTTTVNLQLLAAPPAAPAFSPSPGSYGAAQTVGISSTSAGTIRYTVDGSTPTATTGTVYGAPLTISQTTTVKAIVVGSTGLTSPVTTGTYVINLNGWYSGWTKRRALAIDHTKVAGALTNFPVLVSITDAKLQSGAKADGSDILFTAADGVTKLNHEVESYTSATGQLTAWVQVPAVSSTTDTVLYLYYGNASASAQESPAGVWDANYKGVWHFKTGSGLSLADTTGANNGTTAASPSAGAGKIGGAMVNGATTNVDAKASGFSSQTATLEAWVYPTSTGTVYGRDIVTKYYAGSSPYVSFGLQFDNNNKFDFSIDDNGYLLNPAGTPSALNAWHHVVMVMTPTTVTGYVDGVVAMTYTRTRNMRYLTQDLYFGVWGGGQGSEVEHFVGSLDEVRLSDTARSGPWVATEYANQNAPGTFLTVGTEETPGSGGGNPTTTVTSAPSGLSVTVDGTACTTPCAFQWANGSSHTLSASATQAGTTGTQYVFGSWSDAGAATHTVTAGSSAATYTASYTTQYYLTTAASPTAGGTVTPASGWQNAGAVVSVSASTNGGYQFTGFSGGLTGTTTPQNVTMTGPVTVTATFTAIATTTVTSAPSGLTVTVDGTGCTTPCAFQWTNGSSHTLSAATQAGTTGTQYEFGSWSDTGPATHTVTAGSSSATYTANYTAQYYLTTGASPTAGGTVTPASGWQNAGAVVSIAASANGGYQFTGFSGGLTGTTTPQNVTMTGPVTVTGTFTAIATTTVTSTPTGRTVTVDGTGCTTPCAFQWTNGSSHTLSAATQAGTTGTQYVFGSWSDAGAATHTVTAGSSAVTYTANYTTQYYLTTAASPTAGGTVTPASGWQNAGAVVSISASASGGYQFTSFTGGLTGTTTPQNVTMTGPVTVTGTFTANATTTVTSTPSGRTLTVDGTGCTTPCTFQWTNGSTHTLSAAAQAGTTGTQYVFGSWSDTGAATHTVTAGSSTVTYTASYTTQYYLTTAASPTAGGTVTPASGWQNAGAVVSIAAVANGGYQFTGFSSGLTGTTTPQNVTMAGPVTVAGNFAALSSGSPWYSTAWTKRRALAIDHTKVAGTLTNFPVLVSITDAKLQSGAKADGSDILFTAADGVTKLNHEVESYSSATGQLTAWVQVPAVSSTTDTVLYLYYGNASASAQESPAGVWDANYKGVWHFKTGTGLSLADTTGANSGTTSSSPSAGAGKIGGAMVNGVTTNVDAKASGFSSQTATLEAWVYPTSTGTVYGRDIVTKYYAGSSPYVSFGLQFDNNNKFDFSIDDNGYLLNPAGTPSALNAWHHVVMVMTPTTVTGYVDGAVAMTYTRTRSMRYLTQDLYFGVWGGGQGSEVEHFVGSLDEVRLSDTARSGPWVATEYANQNAPETFLTVGTEEAPGSGGGNPTTTVTSAPTGRNVTVDGTGCTTPCTFQWTNGSSHTLSAATQPGTTGTQYVFGSWSDTGAATHTVTAGSSAVTYTANYTTQYYLTTAASPTAGGTVTPASGWQNAGAVVSIAASANGGYQFTGFSGGLTGTTTPQNVTMAGPVTITGTFTANAITTITSAPTGRNVTVDGTGCTTPCTFQWTNGSSHTLSAATQAGTTGTQYVFGSWSDTGPATHTVTAGSSSATYTANYTTQYYLTTAASPTAGGTVTPASGWQNAGAVVSIAAVANGGYQFTGFSGGLTGTATPQNVTMTGPVTVAGNFAALSSGSPWYSTAWTKRRALAIDHTKVAGTLTNFPMLVSITDAKLQSGAKADGSDILFTAADGVTKLNHEVESYSSATGQLTAWVQVPAVSSTTDTVLYLYYGNASASAQESPAGVWDANYKGVWHFKTGTGLSLADTTGANSGTTTSSPSAGAGKIGGAMVNGVTTNVDAKASGFSSQTATLEAWVYPTSTGTVYGRDIVTKYYAGSSPYVSFGLQFDNNNKFDFSIDDNGYLLNPAGTPSALNAWHHVVMVMTPTTVAGYVDGVVAMTYTRTRSMRYLTQDLYFGVWGGGLGSEVEHFIGSLDEVRLSDTARSGAWVATEYANQNAPGTFLTVGTEETPASTGSATTVRSAPSELPPPTGDAAPIPQNVAITGPRVIRATFRSPTVAGCAILPPDNVWNTPIDRLPVDPNSAAYISTIGAARGLHPDFSSGGGGIPVVSVPGTQPKTPIHFSPGADESDPGPYPVPPNAPIEGGAKSTGDRHVLVLETGTCTLYELFSAYPQQDGSWNAYSGAVFPLGSNQLRPNGWTSADAAGLPILPGLVRYEEVAAGEIGHAIRMTVPQTRNAFVWPARHKASTLTGAQYPPMGQRFRLKAGFDISPYPADVQVILRALKKYGMILADNGSSWYLTGVPDPRWNDDSLHQLQTVLGSNLEAVDESSLMLDPNSGAARQRTGATTPSR